MIKRMIAECWPANRYIRYRLPRKCGPAVALTFDDGPNAKYTPQVLDILAAHQVRATFFLLGPACKLYPALVERIRVEGHAIGIHGTDHTSQNLAQQARECQRLLAQQNVQTQIFRPPRGMLPIREVGNILASRLRVWIWSHDRKDSLRHEGKSTEPAPSPYTIQAQDVVLMHDDNPICLEELPILLQELRNKDLQTMRLDEP